MRFDNNASEEPLAKIFVSTPSVNSEQSISLAWITTTPVQAPAGQEDAVFAYAIDRTTLAGILSDTDARLLQSPRRYQ